MRRAGEIKGTLGFTLKFDHANKLNSCTQEDYRPAPRYQLPAGQCLSSSSYAALDIIHQIQAKVAYKLQ